MSEQPTVELTQAEVDELPPRPINVELGDVWVDHYGGQSYRVRACMWGNILGTDAERIVIVDRREQDA